MAMAKLTGETFDPATMVANPPLSKLTRNNTVAGGERMAPRPLLSHCLDKQLNTNAEQTSAGEKGVLPVLAGYLLDKSLCDSA